MGSKNAEIEVVGVASAMHFLVDALCVCCLYMLLEPLPLVPVVSVIVTYNVLAFLTQPLTGLLADSVRRPHLLLLVSILLLAFAVLLSVIVVMTRAGEMPFFYAVASLLGLGNSFFHVWGGKQVALKTCNDIRSLGVFVSTGAMGLAVGYVFYSWLLLCLLLLSLNVLALVYVWEEDRRYRWDRRNRYDSGNRYGDEKVFSLPLVLLFVVLLMVAVMFRSLVGECFTSDGVVSGSEMTLLVGCVAMLGKMAGGWLARGLGWVKSLALILLGVLVCWFMRGQGIALALVGLFVVNCSMPITLWLANVVLKGREGLAFGLLAAALIPGYLISQI